MTEVTEQDRWAAAQVCGGKDYVEEIFAGQRDDDQIVQAFARHRQYGYDAGYYDGRQFDGKAEREAIVAWLRAFDAPDDFYSNVMADAIKASEHLKGDDQ